MNPTFTAEQFFGVFRHYNETLFPMQVIFYVLAIAALYFVIKPSPKSAQVITCIFAFLWLWMGIVYHLIFFSGINKAAYLFATMFIAEGILFLLYGVFQHKFSFKLRYDVYGVTGIILILFALVIYPVIGYFLGRVYPASPTFGLPCPTTIFTFGLLLLGDKKLPVAILIIPLTWSVIGFTAAFKFGVTEDVALLAAGLITLAMTLTRNRQFTVDMIKQPGKSQPV